MKTRRYRLLALLLPSKGRWLDLSLTLIFVSLRTVKGYRARFFVCANYPAWQLSLFRFIFARRAVVINERPLEWRGLVGAYNYAFAAALESGAEWVAVWADDLLPERRGRLRELLPLIVDPEFRFGIFSSDEGFHQTRFGWNVFGGYPCAHFYVARVDALPGYPLNPKAWAYVMDNEIAVSRIKTGVAVDFLPVRVVHIPTQNPTRNHNTSRVVQDLNVFYELHPELNRKLDDIVLRGDVSTSDSSFFPDKGQTIRFSMGRAGLPIGEFMKEAPTAALTPVVRANIWLRHFTNEKLPSAIFNAKTKFMESRGRTKKTLAKSIALAEIRLGFQDNLVSTLAGQKDPAQGLKTTGNDGFLMLGPYLPVKEGKYKVTVFGKTMPGAGHEITFDVVYDKGEAIAAEKSVSEPEAKLPSGEEVLGTVEFSLSRDVPDLEIRARVTAKTQLAITRYEMVPNP